MSALEIQLLHSDFQKNLNYKVMADWKAMLQLLQEISAKHLEDVDVRNSLLFFSKCFQYLGCALVILIVFYIVMSLCNYQLKLVETLTNMSSDSVSTAATIKESTTKTLDTLLINKLI